MNKIFQIQGRIGIVLLLLASVSRISAQSTATCNLNIGGTNYPVNAAVQANCQTGLDFNLSITLPGLSNCNGNYDVSITTSNNMLLGSNSTVPFGGTPYTYQNTATISNNIGRNILVAFKFKPGVTCNGEKGTFAIRVTTSCNGQPVTCDLNVSLLAVAKNYWVVEKKHLWGDMRGGSMLWKITLKNTNGNPGIGDYNIAYGKITDNINCDYVTAVSGVTYGGISGLNTNTASWYTGPVASTVPYKEFIVTTVCCTPGVATATNCATYNLSLGKGGLFDRPCDVLNGQVCDNKPVKDVAGFVVPFSKGLTYNVNTQVNYAQGCEGEYVMCISNTGNIPLSNLNLSDLFPSGIDVTNICISTSGGVNMNYTCNFGSGVPASGSGNVSSNPCWNFSTPPSQLNFQTTSGSLTYGSICFRIRFRITAAPGTPIRNCATLNYSGTFDGWANICGINFPPIPTTSPVTSCVDFTVEQPRVIPGLAKCISTGVQSYLVGQTIPFCIVVSNHGQAAMSGYTLADLLGPTPQNLEILPGSVTYATGTGYYPGYTPCCPSVGPASATPPAWVTANISNIQNPSWTINGLPGECRFDQASYLVIKFDALVKPQNYGNYNNIAKLTGGGNSLSANAFYNILRIAEIQTTKLVNNGPGQTFASTGYVNPGAAFQYLLRVQNIGSVSLNTISAKDAFPPCVRHVCPNPAKTYTIYAANGTPKSTVTVNCTTVAGTTTFTLSPATTTLAPGDYVDIIVDVTRVINTPEIEPCCNREATGYGTAADNGGQTIQDSDGPVCVQKSICCDLEEIKIQPTTLFPPTTGNYWNFGLNIFAGNLPIQEVDISVMDYHFSYNDVNCKPANVGNYTGHLATTTPVIGSALNLSGPNGATNNLLNWKAGTPVLFTGGQNIRLHIMRPNVLPLPCCKGTFYYCVKVRLKDVKCRVCEKIVCFTVPMGSVFPTDGGQELLNLSEQDFRVIEGN